MAQKPTIFVVLLSVFLTSFSALGLSENPFIVAHKRVTLTKLKSSSAERVSVSIDIYNRGSATAYDITLSDDSWDNDVFHIVSGNTSRTWGKLEAGSELSHSFELESDVKIVYHGSPALITYRIPTQAKLQEAYSTPIVPLEILADPVSFKKTELAIICWQSMVPISQ
ncbi:hypothetical protein Leryth_023611 [Lithospermum erythrorhizon]|nr:hypothetical protein Leryth_023611 [Lithospermum erythrorhizon]